MELTPMLSSFYRGALIRLRVMCRLTLLKTKGRGNTESKNHAPNKPIVWPIYDDAPKADKHLDVPSAEDSSLPKEEVDELLESGQIWGITSFFNPEGYQNKIDNFRLFRKRITFGQVLIVQEAGIPVFNYEAKHLAFAHKVRLGGIHGCV
eukprot:1094130-Prorocentrum_minimum.AAC.2